MSKVLYLKPFIQMLDYNYQKLMEQEIYIAMEEEFNKDETVEEIRARRAFELVKRMLKRDEDTKIEDELNSWEKEIHQGGWRSK